MTVSTKIDINRKEVLKDLHNPRRFTEMNRHFLPFGLIILACTIACNQGPPKPEDNLKAFLGAVRSKRGPEAWKLLSAASQSELTKRAKRIAEITETPVETNKSKLLFQEMEIMTIRIPESISVTSPISSTAKLRVALKDGQTANVLMIREGQAWKVDLLGSLSPIPTSTVVPDPPPPPKDD